MSLKQSSSPSLPPKEIESILDTITEFIFNFGPASGAAGSGGTPKKSRQNTSSANQSGSNAAIQELQMLNTMLDFFKTCDSDSSVLCTVFAFLFMEPASSSSGSKSPKRDRMEAMAKLLALAMYTRNQPVLYSAGVWMHQTGPASPRALQLTKSIIQDHILLIPDPISSLHHVPEQVPLLASHLMSSATVIYSKKGLEPPNTLLELFNSWIETWPLLPLTPVCNSVLNNLAPAAAVLVGATGISGSASQSTSPIMGLAAWTVMGRSSCPVLISKLHLSLLDCLSKTRELRDNFRSEIVSVKKVTMLIQDVEIDLDHDDRLTEEIRHICLDRLGQFLQAVTAARCLSGKTSEIVVSLKRLPANRMIQVYVVNLAKA